MRELWCRDERWVEEHTDEVRGKIKHQVYLMDSAKTDFRSGYCVSSAEANIKALLWLAEKGAGE